MNKTDTSVNNLINKAKSGLKWTTLVKFTAQLFSWSVSLIVVRFLMPEDFGLKAMAELLFAFLTLLAAGGFNSALIQTKALSDYQLRQMFTLILVFNIFLAFIQFSLSFYIADYYQESKVIPIIQVLSIGFFLLPFISIHSAILSRNMEFKKASLAILFANVSGGIITLTLAINNFGVWSLVFGQLITLLLRAIALIYVTNGIIRTTFDFSNITHLIKFGSTIVTTTIIWYIFQKVDIIIGGKFLTTTELGFYALAIHVASLPMDKIIPLLNQVAFPTYSRIQTDNEKIKYYFLKSVRIVSYITLPIFFGLAILSENFVLTVFGEKWLVIALPLAILSITTCFRTLNNLFSPAVNASGFPHVQLINAIFSLIIMSIAMYIGSNWGLMGLAYSWLVGYSVIFFVTSYRSCKALNINYKDFIHQITRALLYTLIMTTVVILSKKHIYIDTYSWINLFTLILIGFFSYTISLYTLNKKSFFEIIYVLKK